MEAERRMKKRVKGKQATAVDYLTYIGGKVEEVRRDTT